MKNLNYCHPRLWQNLFFNGYIGKLWIRIVHERSIKKINQFKFCFFHIFESSFWQLILFSDRFALGYWYSVISYCSRFRVALTVIGVDVSFTKEAIGGAGQNSI
jgi:hypothetical protein